MLVVFLLCDMAVLWCAALQCQKSVRRDQIKQICGRREMPISNKLQQGRRVSTVEGMTTLMASKNKQLSSPNKPCGVFLPPCIHSGGESSSASLWNKKNPNQQNCRSEEGIQSSYQQAKKKSFYRNWRLIPCLRRQILLHILSTLLWKLKWKVLLMIPLLLIQQI